MPPTVVTPPDRSNSAPAAGATSALVLLAVALPVRRERLCAAIDRIAPQARVETAESVLDAMLRSAGKPADLLVLDLAIDLGLAPVLLRHLARIAPATTVLVFDDLAHPLSGHPGEVRPWSEVDAALQRWFEGRCCHGQVRPTV